MDSTKQRIAMQSPSLKEGAGGEKESNAEWKTLPRKLPWRTLTYTEADQVTIKEHMQDNKLCHKIGLKKGLPGKSKTDSFMVLLGLEYVK